MSTKRPSQLDHARRHFLGLAAATGARVAAMGIAASTILPSFSAQAHQGGNEQGENQGGNEQGGNSRHPCFLRGTSILTPTGEVRVEDIQIGDLVGTAHGRAMPVKWIGRTLYKRSGRSWNSDVVPIRISRHALDDRTPHRDLYLSPGHALFIDGDLILAKFLVNGISIVPAPPADGEAIEYFHVMLESHEVILAEGAPAESYLPGGGNHEHFTNFAEFARLYPDSLAMKPFAPVVGFESGRDHLKALLRLGMHPFEPVSDPYEPVHRAYERIAARAEQQVVAAG
ncbi:Hint domain-containing protein [Rhizobium sp. P32RR-XVIII]|uniref:Hint domain-containing protein n=1 Tax=Rhizobium sp. P32RR-XVIII TaxID=2726738 RepID=UPI0014576097|nr:Hint domain-containing protein [Rhizobium sp. P32RR-XVIII]NLS05605.1 Hint domain-containing protein [Rhizobium sp. P32RR-XVIII]